MAAYGERPKRGEARPGLRPTRLVPSRLVGAAGLLVAAAPQTRAAFVLAPEALPNPDEPIVGAAAVHELLAHRRALLQPDAAVVAVGSR